MNNFRKISQKHLRQLAKAANHAQGAITKKLKVVPIRQRLRGTAIVDTPEGILLVSSNGNRFSLPGGGATKQETGEAAAIRELKEETGLQATSTHYLFSHTGGMRKRNSGLSRNHHEVFWVEVVGKARPKQEIKAIQFYHVGDQVAISNSTQIILEKYLSLKQSGAIADLKLRDKSILSLNAQKVQNALIAAELTTPVTELAQPIHSPAEMAQVLGCEIAQIAQAIVFRRKKTGLPLLAIASAAHAINVKWLGEMIGESVTKANARQVREWTGFTIDAVPPIAHTLPLETLLDQDLLQYSELWMTAGTPSTVFSITPEELVELTRAQVIAVSP